jgi:hypothetical protein
MQTTHNGQGGGKPTIFGQRGLEIRKSLIDYYISHTTLPCRQVGQEIKNETNKLK